MKRLCLALLCFTHYTFGMNDQNHTIPFNSQIHAMITISLHKTNLRDQKVIVTNDYQITIDNKLSQIKVQDNFLSFKKVGPFELTHYHPQYAALLHELNNIAFIRMQFPEVKDLASRGYVCEHSALRAIDRIIKNL